MATGHDLRDITVILATHDRAEDLRRTLEAMERVDRNGLSVEFVVVDNNSKDATRAVVESMAGRLPLTYLFEPRPGKNCALNFALDRVELGRIVVFTDDDVDPRPDWLRQVAAGADRWPEDRVFGGIIDVIWPRADVPGWALELRRQGWGFAVHDFGDVEAPMPPGRTPGGPNFWVRREVFADGLRYNEDIGPRPVNRMMGSETSFLMALAARGNRIIYVPAAMVGHRIQPELLAEKSVYTRAYRSGRGMARMKPLEYARILERAPVGWFLIRYLSLIRKCASWLIRSLSLSRDRRVVRRIPAIAGIAFDIECLRIARERRAERSGEARREAGGPER